MNTVSDPTLDAMLSEVAALGLRASRVVVRLMEVEQAAVEVIAHWLPMADAAASDTLAAAQGVDAVDAALAVAAPRIEILARALDRMSRSVRHSVALLRRMQSGWPRAARADDRLAMTRRQVGRGVAEVIRRESRGVAAERLFDDLAVRLEDPDWDADLGSLPVEEAVRRICRDLGLAADALRGVAPGREGEAGEPTGSDTG